MLKINDNVDLKELKKFKFIKTKKKKKKKNIFAVTVLMVFDNKKISTPTDDNGNVILYDLIQAGLVEKVEDK